MASTFKLISWLAVTSSPTSVSFTSIPSTYDDLVLMWTGKEDIHNGELFGKMTFNSSTTGYKHRYTYGISSNTQYRTYSTGRSDVWGGLWTANGKAANHWGQTTLYIPDYKGSKSKTFFFDSFAGGDSSTEGSFAIHTGMWDNTSAITSINMASDQGSYNIYTGSNFYLYGISKS